MHGAVIMMRAGPAGGRGRRRSRGSAWPAGEGAGVPGDGGDRGLDVNDGYEAYAGAAECVFHPGSVSPVVASRGARNGGAGGSCQRSPPRSVIAAVARQCKQPLAGCTASGDAEGQALRGDPAGYGAGWPVARRRRGGSAAEVPARRARGGEQIWRSGRVQYLKGQLHSR